MSSDRQLYLAKYRPTSSSRAHFAIFIPNSTASSPNVPHADTSKPLLGTVIHVVGAPMVGFTHEFKRNYDVNNDPELTELVAIGSVDRTLVVDPETAGFSRDAQAISVLEKEALKVDPPRRSDNFLAPVNDTTNRRCQEWTMDFLRRLVKLGHLDSTVVDVVQGHRDPPSLGIGLRPVKG